MMPRELSSPARTCLHRKYGLDVTLIDETIGTHKTAARDAVLQTISAARRLDVSPISDTEP
jgi:hypothetical protein